MAICANCGKKMADYHLYCRRCGTLAAKKDPRALPEPEPEKRPRRGALSIAAFVFTLAALAAFALVIILGQTLVLTLTPVTWLLALVALLLLLRAARRRKKDRLEKAALACSIALLALTTGLVILYAAGVAAAFRQIQSGPALPEL